MIPFTLRDAYSYVTNPDNDIADRTTTLFVVGGIAAGGIHGYIKPFREPASAITIGDVVFNVFLASPLTSVRYATVIGFAGFMSGAIYGRVFKFLFSSNERARTIKPINDIVIIQKDDMESLD